MTPNDDLNKDEKHLAEDAGDSRVHGNDGSSSSDETSSGGDDNFDERELNQTEQEIQKISGDQEIRNTEEFPGDDRDLPDQAPNMLTEAQNRAVVMLADPAKHYGRDFKSMAKELNVDVTTLYRWQRIPAFRHAYRMKRYESFLTKTADFHRKVYLEAMEGDMQAMRLFVKLAEENTDKKRPYKSEPFGQSKSDKPKPVIANVDAAIKGMGGVRMVQELMEHDFEACMARGKFSLELPENSRERIYNAEPRPALQNDRMEAIVYLTHPAFADMTKKDIAKKLGMSRQTLYRATCETSFQEEMAEQMKEQFTFMSGDIHEKLFELSMGLASKKSDNTNTPDLSAMRLFKKLSDILEGERRLLVIRQSLLYLTWEKHLVGKPGFKNSKFVDMTSRYVLPWRRHPVTGDIVDENDNPIFTRSA